MAPAERRPGDNVQPKAKNQLDFTLAQQQNLQKSIGRTGAFGPPEVRLNPLKNVGLI